MFGMGIIQGGKFLKRPPIIINGNVVDVTRLKMDMFKDSMVLGINNIKNTNNNGFVASKRGKYYYPKDCKLADGLSSANLIFFNTEKEAMDAGYIKQTKCD